LGSAAAKPADGTRANEARSRKDFMVDSRGGEAMDVRECAERDYDCGHACSQSGSLDRDERSMGLDPVVRKG
jgi:hypothetical protein